MLFCSQSLPILLEITTFPIFIIIVFEVFKNKIMQNVDFSLTVLIFDHIIVCISSLLFFIVM